VAVTVRVAVDADAVEMELTNPLGNGTAAVAPPRSGGGRGLAGMQERVGVLRGEFAAGPRSGVWRVHARLPLAP
jgi:signal transduction histidine kinase